MKGDPSLRSGLVYSNSERKERQNFGKERICDLLRIRPKNTTAKNLLVGALSRTLIFRIWGSFAALRIGVILTTTKNPLARARTRDTFAALRIRVIPRRGLLGPQPISWIGKCSA